MPDPYKTVTITLTNSATVTITCSSTMGGPEVKQMILQGMRSGGFFANDGAFYPSSAILKIAMD